MPLMSPISCLFTPISISHVPSLAFSDGDVCVALHNYINCIGGVMVSVLASSAVDRGFEPRSSQTNDY